MGEKGTWNRNYRLQLHFESSWKWGCFPHTGHLLKFLFAFKTSTTSPNIQVLSLNNCRVNKSPCSAPCRVPGMPWYSWYCFHLVPSCTCYAAPRVSSPHLSAVLSELNVAGLNMEEAAIWEKFLWGLFSVTALLPKAVANPKQSLRPRGLAVLLVLIMLTYCLSPWKGARYIETLV